eukprot:11526123-Alexandrium_andersonii.AAC.1
MPSTAFTAFQSSARAVNAKSPLPPPASNATDCQPPAVLVMRFPSTRMETCFITSRPRSTGCFSGASL